LRHTPIIPDTSEAAIRKIAVQGQPGQKANEVPSQPISQAWWCMFVILTITGGIGSRMIVQASLGKNTRPYPINN
jgi:hypothetical protein